MKYNEVFLDESILDIESWLPKEILNEIAEEVFGVKTINSLNFELPTSHISKYKENEKHLTSNNEVFNAEYNSIKSNEHFFDISYSYKGVA